MLAILGAHDLSTYHVIERRHGAFLCISISTLARERDIWMIWMGFPTFLFHWRAFRADTARDANDPGCIRADTRDIKVTLTRQTVRTRNSSWYSVEWKGVREEEEEEEAVLSCNLQAPGPGATYICRRPRGARPTRRHTLSFRDGSRLICQ